MLTGGSSRRSISGRVTCAVAAVGLVSMLWGLVLAGCGTDSAPLAGLGFTSEIRGQARAWRLELWSDPALTVGSLVIPKIGLDVVVVEGVGTGDLEQGPGHWPETPLPGQNGRVVISGHRSTFGAPFLRLDELCAGDEIRLVLPYGTAVYAVTGQEVVGPEDVDHVRQRGLEEITLATCHPVFSEKYRLLVHANALIFIAAP